MLRVGGELLNGTSFQQILHPAPLKCSAGEQEAHGEGPDNCWRAVGIPPLESNKISKVEAFKSLQILHCGKIGF